MPIEAKHFIEANRRKIDDGTRVRYSSKRYGSGTGIVTLIYYGAEEFVKVRRDLEEPTYCRAGFAPPDIDLWIEGDNVFRVEEEEPSDAKS